MEHKMIFFEGQPGSGKSTLSQYIYRQLKLHNVQVGWIDEYEHDAICFHDFWEKYESIDEDIVSILLDCWSSLIERIRKSGKTILMDSAFFSYTLYLLNLELSKETIEKYFVELNSILADLKPRIILLRGDTETILKRACARRGTAWTSSAINKVAQGPYQISRNRQGFEGLVKYFKMPKAYTLS